jgi:hypothetical protein
MPWKSAKQRAWGHSLAGIKALGGKKAVEEWDKATRNKKLPKVALKKKGK